jgi:hypothetical protein
MQKGLLVALLLGILTSVAAAMDMKDLAPCKPAAARFCDWSSSGSTWSRLMNCGATLASKSNRVGEPCREVLRRYGQL